MTKFQNANKLFVKKKYEEAITLYRECLVENPHFEKYIALNIKIAEKKLCKKHQDDSKLRICLVTEELAGISPSGGIGAAFLELGRELTNSGYIVDVLFCNPVYFGKSEFESFLTDKFSTCFNLCYLLEPEKFTYPPFTAQKNSYAVYCWLDKKEKEGCYYDFIHFHDYKGLGYFSLEAKRQYLAFSRSQFVIQVHGPTRWAIQANNRFFTDPEQLRVDFLEKMSIELSDHVVAPSQYILDWIKNNDFAVISENKKRVIKNCLPTVSFKNHEYRLSSDNNLKTLVFFGRHEQRKGLKVFCKALNLLNYELVKKSINVVFLGGLGFINDLPSLFYLEEQSRNWNFDFEFKTSLLRDDAISLLLNLKNPLICVCSNYENSPYTVFEVLHLGLPIIFSKEGGAVELLDDPNYPGVIQMNSEILSNKISEFISKPFPPPKPKENSREVATKWNDFHVDIYFKSKNKIGKNNCRLFFNEEIKPLVSVIVTHYERVEKVKDSVESIFKQTYPNIELIVVDDGSHSQEAINFLDSKLEPSLKKRNGLLIRQKNSYLGAARNAGLYKAKGDYVCFLDDDDIAVPNMIEILVNSIVSCDADVVIPFNSYMPESDRDQIKASNNKNLKPSYLPTGGPYTLAAIENCIGAATSLFKKSTLISIGGYTEVYGVGHEDYELYTKFLESGKKIAICPKVLYFYEVGRPSMLSSTSVSENFMRNFSSYKVDYRAMDLVSLMVGTKVDNIKKNRISWTMGNRNKAIIQKVVDSQFDPKDAIANYLKLLSEEKNTHSLFYIALKKEYQRLVGT